MDFSRLYKYQLWSFKVILCLLVKRNTLIEITLQQKSVVKMVKIFVLSCLFTLAICGAPNLNEKKGSEGKKPRSFGY